MNLQFAFDLPENSRDHFTFFTPRIEWIVIAAAVMSNAGSSSTQIGECGIISDQEVAIVDSLDSITTANSDDDDGSSDCSSDISSSYISDPDEEPISIVTNIRPSPVNPADEEEEKSPSGGRIAKDTGCCLYSAITAIFVMVVLLGIVLIVTGPVLGLSFPPLLRANTPAILPPIEHNYLTSNFSDEGSSVDEDVNTIHSSSNQSDADYPAYDPGDVNHNQTNDSFEYVDYLDSDHQLQTTNLTDYLTAINNTVGIFNESVIEDLANLSPEALRTKYVAYVPIPLKIDDDDEQTDYHDQVDDTNTDINDRNDDDNYNNNNDDTYYDEEMVMTPRSSSIRRRPSATIDKVLLPIVMVPETSGEQRSKSTSHQGSNSWRSDDFSEDRPNYPPRRFDEDQSEIRTEHDDEEDLTSSPSLRIPGLNPPRRNRPDRKRGPGIDYRMFGSLTNQDNRRNRRPNRPRDRERIRPRDDFGRTTSLHPHRVLPPPSSRLRPRNNKGNHRQRTVEGREGSPALYIRPPPRPRPRNAHPARQRVHRPPPPPVKESWLNRQRTIDSPATSTKRPTYSYPRDAMSIQDIISYMTSMSHSNEQTTKKPLTPTGPEHRSEVWTSPDYYSTNNQRQGESYPSILPPPPSMGISRMQDNLPVESHTRGTSSGSSNPYSFKLDVYPMRDSLGGGSSSSNYVPPGPSYRQQSVLPPNNYRYRPTSPYYETRQPSGDSSGSLSDPYYYRSQRRPQAGSGSQEQSRYRDDDDMPLPLAFRPRRPETSVTTPKPKLIVHLNVFNQKGGRNRYPEERQDNQEEEDYYSPSDIYRAVLRNNAAKTDHDAGGDDNIMLSGQSRVDTFSQHQMDDAGISAGSSSSSSHLNSNSYDNHNMAASSPTDQYYRSVGMRRPSPVNTATSNNNYRLSHQSRNFYPSIDDDVPEPLPMPMAAQQDDCNSSALGVNCTQGSVSSSIDQVNNITTTTEPPLAS